MNIGELVNMQVENISVTVTLNDLREFTRDIVSEALEQFEKSRSAESYTPKEVSTLLKVTYPTLHRWAARGYLKPFKVGGLIRYHKEDIHKLIERNSDGQAKSR